MLIDGETGAFISKQINYPGGPGLVEITAAADDPTVALERLGGNGLTWVVIELTTISNTVINIDLDKCILRLDQAAGTNVFADIKTRRISP